MDIENIKYGRNYSKREYLLRVLWFLALPLFRYSPRIAYGWRNVLLRIFGAKIGKAVKIYPSAKIIFPWNLTVGDFSIISWEVKIYNLGKIKIGSKTIISQYAHICAGNHDIYSEDFNLLKTPITIGNMVWIATDVFVAPGVSIGDRSVIYARSVVINNIPGDCIAGGHPAKVLKENFR